MCPSQWPDVLHYRYPAARAKYGGPVINSVECDRETNLPTRVKRYENVFRYDRSAVAVAIVFARDDDRVLFSFLYGTVLVMDIAMADYAPWKSATTRRFGCFGRTVICIRYRTVTGGLWHGRF